MNGMETNMSVQSSLAGQRHRMPCPLSPLLDRVVPDTDAAIGGRRDCEPAASGVLWSRQNRRRAEILRQTRILIGHQGYTAFSIRKVAENCEVAPQTVYNLLGDREQVLEAAIGQHVSAMVTAARKLEGPPGFFMAFAEVLWGHALKNPDYVRTVTRAQFSARCTPIPKVQTLLTDVFRAELSTLGGRGDLRDGIDIALLAEHLLSVIIMAAFTWVESDGDDSALRRQLVTGLGLPLLGAMSAMARRPIEEWTDAIQANGATHRRRVNAAAGAAGRG